MKKISSLIFVFLLITAMMIVLVSCGESSSNQGDIVADDTDHTNEGNDNSGETSGHSHTWILGEEVSPSCNAFGEIKYYCLCGEEKVELAAMIGHDVRGTVCSVCDKGASKGLDYTLSDDKTYYSVSGIGTCDDEDVIIPAVYNGLPVKQIDVQAFKYCSSIVSVSIAEGITEICSYAFTDCDNLISVKLPQTLEAIGSLAFNACDSLNTINLPQSVSLGSYAFGNCFNLETINVDSHNEGYKSIDGVLYSYNYEYKTVGDEIKKYKTGSLSLLQYPCGKKDTLFRLPTDATKVSACAFQSAANLEKIELHEEVCFIGRDAFVSCLALQEIDIPDKVETISKGCFYSCEELKVVKLGKNVRFEQDEFEFNGSVKLERFEVDDENAYYKTIDGNLYSKDGRVLLRYCSGKDDSAFKVPSGVVSIAKYAFSQSKNLKTIEIDSFVKQIGDYAFAYCDMLSTISYTGSISEWYDVEFGKNIWGYERYPEGTISCKDGVLAFSKE